jgi:hypothetical protein
MALSATLARLSGTNAFSPVFGSIASENRSYWDLD